MKPRRPLPNRTNPAAEMPHCDQTILHAPGRCKYCDEYPEWQSYRQLARIAFTGEDPSLENSPCPSEWFRDKDTRDLWPGNRAKP